MVTAPFGIPVAEQETSAQFACPQTLAASVYPKVHVRVPTEVIGLSWDMAYYLRTGCAGAAGHSEGNASWKLLAAVVAILRRIGYGGIRVDSAAWSKEA